VIREFARAYAVSREVTPPRLCPISAASSLLIKQEPLGLPGFLGVSLSACHGLWTPPDLHTLAHLRSDASVLPSVYVKTLGVRNWLCRSCISTSGSATSPTAYRILCVRLPHILFAVTCSSVRSTLDTGGRLPLTRLGLSPCKIHRAWPGAITLKVRGWLEAGEARCKPVPLDRWVGRLSVQRTTP